MLIVIYIFFFIIIQKFNRTIEFSEEYFFSLILPPIVFSGGYNLRK